MLPFLSALFLIATTSSWYWFSSINAIATQRLFTQVNELFSVNNDSSVEYPSDDTVTSLALLLTTCQLIVGAILSAPLAIKYLFDETELSPIIPISVTARNQQGSNISKLIGILLGLLHYLGCLCTNTGFGYGSASLVQCVKLLEPIETLLLSAIVKSTFPPSRKIISTLIIVTGTSLLLSQKSMEANVKSIGLALISGLCMSSRNVLNKFSQKKGWAQNSVNDTVIKSENIHADKGGMFKKGLAHFIYITTMAAIPATFISMTFMITGLVPINRTLSILFYKFQSPENFIKAVFFHCLYNVASITVLTMTSAPVHSLLNVGKRIINVLTAAIVFSVPISSTGKVGIILAMIGSLLYDEGSTAIFQTVTTKFHSVVWKHRNRFIVMLFGVCAFLSLVNQQQQLLLWDRYRVTYGNDELALRPQFIGKNLKQQSAEVIQSDVEIPTNHTRKVVLLGPHDRYNFGDLLFEKVVSHLLVHRAGLPEENIIRAGLVTTTYMKQYGGPEQIYSLRDVQKQSFSSELPFDVVSLGGEASACSFDTCALLMLPEHYREAANQSKIYDCGYVIPKEILVPRNYTGPSNLGIINSLGGKPLGDCRSSFTTADYLSFRDTDKNPELGKQYLSPDSAVMVEHLFGDLIEAFEVPNEIPIDKPYIAVQHKGGILPHELAPILDEISFRNGNITIIFFCAGTADLHDSVDAYKQLARNMTAPTHIVEHHHVWLVCKIISHAKWVFSTSLHVRIIAWQYQRSRNTWCTNSKHKRFLQLWDNKSSPCVDFRNKTIEAMSTSRPALVEDIRQIQERYLQNFDRWSAMVMDEKNRVILPKKKFSWGLPFAVVLTTILLLGFLKLYVTRTDNSVRCTLS